MKKLIAILFFATITAVAFGQTQFGVKGGFNLSNLAVNQNEIDNTNMKVGYTAGIFAQIPIFDWLLIQPEALFTRKGANYDFDNTSVKAGLNYVDIPVMGVLKVFNTPVSIHAGPQFSFLANAKYQYESPLFGNEIVVDKDKNSFNSFDPGVAAGIGLNLDKLQIEVRVTRGFQNVEKDRTILSQAFSARDTKNFGLQLTAGLIL